MKNFLVIILIGSSFICQAQWTQIGANQGSTGGACGVSMVFNPSTNQPYVAFPDAAANAFKVLYFNGASWLQVGVDVGFTGGDAGISMAFHPTTYEPYVAYPDAAANAFIVRRFDGSNWIQVGSNLGFASSGAGISIAFDPASNYPYVAYADGAANAYKVELYNGSTWSQLGTNLGFASSGTISLAFSPANNQPYVAFPDGAANAFQVQGYSGASWVQVGTNLGFASSDSGIDMDFNPGSQEPYVIYSDGAANSFKVESFNGLAWAQLGGNLGFASGGVGASISFRPFTNEPYIIYPDGAANSFKVSSFNGSVWAQIGSDLGFSSGGGPFGGTLSPDIRFRQLDSEPYVFYPDAAINAFVAQRFPCSPTTSSITITACEEYISPSGISYTSSGIYEDTIANSLNCDSIITIDLTIYPLPSVTVTQNGSLLTASQAGGTYQWLDCNNSYSVINGETNQSYTPAETGNYAIEVNINGCIDTSACFLVDYTGIEELNSANKELVKIIDFMGRETEFKSNTPLIFIYSDGTRERVMKIEE